MEEIRVENAFIRPAEDGRFEIGFEWEGEGRTVECERKEIEYVLKIIESHTYILSWPLNELLNRTSTLINYRNVPDKGRPIF